MRGSPRQEKGGVQQDSRFVVVIGGSREARAAGVRRHIEHALATHASMQADVRVSRGSLLQDDSAWCWPFQRQVTPQAPPTPAIVWIRDLHEAFPAGQTAGTRLVLTQATYQLQRWLDWLQRHPHVSVVADAETSALARGAPEYAAGRGPWRHIRRLVLPGEPHAFALPARPGPPDDLAVAPSAEDPLATHPDQDQPLDRRSSSHPIGRRFISNVASCGCAGMIPNGRQPRLQKRDGS
jgi:hypothetical protein